MLHSSRVVLHCSGWQPQPAALHSKEQFSNGLLCIWHSSYRRCVT